MVNGRAWRFTHDGWDYQIVNLNGSEAVRLWYRVEPGADWQHGQTRQTHGRGVALVARAIHEQITG
jgi:hypothetical protein